MEIRRVLGLFRRRGGNGQGSISLRSRVDGAWSSLVTSALDSASISSRTSGSFASSRRRTRSVSCSRISSPGSAWR